MHERESDLYSNHAYGGAMFDIGLVVGQDETYTNDHTTVTVDSRPSGGGITLNLNECQTESATRDSNKVTVTMKDNAAYYTNLSQVTEV